MSTVHAIIRQADEAVYFVRRMRTEESFWLPIYHYRADDGTWHKLRGAGTLAEARHAVQHQTLISPWQESPQPERFYRS